MQLFRPFDSFHLGALVSIVLLAFFAAFLGSRVKSAAVDRSLRFGLILVLFGNEIYMHMAAIEAGEWRHSWALPLHLCDLSIFALMVALGGKSQVAWELAYYWGLGGSSAALVTPDIPLGYPHYYFTTFFIHHGGVLIGVIYLTFSGKYTLQVKSIGRVWTITHVYVLMIAAYNGAMKTNFLFLCTKPSQPSLLDYLGPWPYYLLGLEAIFTFTLIILFWVYQRIAHRSIA